jgi:DNA mismatch repair protein MutL
VIRDLVAEDGRGEIRTPLEAALKVTACHGAIRAGKSLSMKEMTSLLTEMEEEGFHRTCPHGRPAWVEISQHDLEKMFMRSS